MSDALPLDARAAPAMAADAATGMHVVYAMYALGFFFPLLWLAGLIVAYALRSSYCGTWLESHCRWAIGTFWRALALVLLWIFPAVVLTVALAVTIIGAPLVVLVWLFPLAWMIYRIVLGWTALFDGKPVVSLFR
jgi:uncharacterized membrane protein